MLPGLTFMEIAEHFFNMIKVSDEYKKNQATPCNKEDLLVPKFKDVVKDKLIAECAKQGVKILPRETFRTNALQLHYYNTGASKIKKNGMHHYGVAWDLLCLDNNGKVIDNGSDKSYITMRKIAEGFGIHLLGLWDAGHMQAVATSEQNSLRNFVANYKSGEAGSITLSFGTENHYVGNLKVALQAIKDKNGKPYLSDEYDPKNYFFGSDTEEAVKALQTDNNLESDGVVGKNTINLLTNLGHDIRK